MTKKWRQSQNNSLAQRNHSTIQSPSNSKGQLPAPSASASPLPLVPQTSKGCGRLLEVTGGGKEPCRFLPHYGEMQGVYGDGELGNTAVAGKHHWGNRAGETCAFGKYYVWGSLSG